MILDNFKRLIVEDFDPKDRAMISKVAYAVNSFADDVLQAFQNNISINDNLAQQELTVNVTVDNTGTPTSKTTFNTTLTGSITGILVTDAYPVSTSTALNGSISAISAASPTLITSASHGLSNGTKVIISASNSVPIIDGLWSVGVIDKNTFTIPLPVTTAGTKGNFKLASYPTGVPFINFTQSSTTITINNVTDLPPNQQYTLNIILFT